MKALCFIFLLLPAAISPSLAAPARAAPEFIPFQRVVYTILTRHSVFSYDYWWDVEKKTLTTGFRHSPTISPQGNSFLHTIQSAIIRPLYFTPPHPASTTLRFTGTVTFTPPSMEGYDGEELQEGSIRPGIFAAGLDTVRFSHLDQQLFHIDIAGIIVTILPPNRRHLDPEAGAALVDRQRITNWYEYLPRLPRPYPNPDPSDPWSSGVGVEYVLDDSTWRTILEDEYWELENKNIICTNLGASGLAEDNAVRLLSPAHLLSGPQSWLSWLAYKLFDDLSIFEQDQGIQSRTPITDCSNEASTSGTKNEKEDLRR